MSNLSRWIIPALSVPALGAVGCLIALEPSSARAADQTADVSNPDTELQEIVVVARRREEKLQDVPVSITSLGAQDMQDKGIKTLDDLQTVVPSLDVQDQRDRDSTLPGIRGIKSNEISPDQQKVTTLYDGMPTIGTQSVTQFVDVDRVEVYRGPQSAQFGRSVFAGAINYLSKPADLEKFDGHADGTYGTDGLAQGDLLLTGPIITDKLGVLLALHQDNYDGPAVPGQSDGITSSDGYKLGGTQTRYLSAKITYKPIDWANVTLRYQHLDTFDEPSDTYALDVSNPQFQALPASIAPRVGTPNFVPALTVLGQVNFALPATAFNRNFCIPGGTYSTAPGPTNGTFVIPVGPNNVNTSVSCITDPSNRINRNRYSYDVEFDAWGGSTISARGFYSWELQTRRDDSDRTSLAPYYNPFLAALPGQTGVVNPTNDEYDYLPIKEHYGELVWVSPANSRLRGSLGASYYSYDFATFLYFDVPETNPNQVFSDDTRNRGVYGSLQYDVIPALTVSAEARYQQDTVLGYNPNTPAPGQAPPPQPIATVTDTFLPRFSATFKVDPNLSLYAQVAKGDNPGGNNPDVVTPSKQAYAAQAGNTCAGANCLALLNSFLKYREEILWNYELGAKGSFFDRKLSFDADVYVLDWQNFQNVTNVSFATIPGVPPPATSSRDTFNEGNVHGKGVELSGEWRPIRAFTMNLAYFHNSMTYASACSPNIVQFGFALSTTPTFAGEQCVNVNGNKVPLIPSDALSVAFAYTNAFPNGVEWTNRVQGYFESKQYIDDSDLSWIAARETTQFRSMVSRGHASLAFFVTNLFDNRTPTSAGDGGGGANYVYNHQNLAVPPVPTNYIGMSGYTATVAAPREYGLTLDYRF